MTDDLGKVNSLVPQGSPQPLFEEVNVDVTEVAQAMVLPSGGGVSPAESPSAGGGVSPAESPSAGGGVSPAESPSAGGGGYLPPAVIGGDSYPISLSPPSDDFANLISDSLAPVMREAEGEGTDVLHGDLVLLNSGIQELVKAEQGEEGGQVVAGAKSEGVDEGLAAAVTAKEAVTEYDTSSIVDEPSSMRPPPSPSHGGPDEPTDLVGKIDAIGKRFANPLLLVDDAVNALSKGIDKLRERNREREEALDDDPLADALSASLEDMGDGKDELALALEASVSTMSEREGALAGLEASLQQTVSSFQPVDSALVGETISSSMMSADVLGTITYLLADIRDNMDVLALPEPEPLSADAFSSLFGIGDAAREREPVYAQAAYRETAYETAGGVVGESPLAESPAPANAPVGFGGGVMDAEMGSGDSSLLGGILEPANVPVGFRGGVMDAEMGVVGESPLAESPAPANAPAEMGSGDSSLLGGILEPASDAKEPETAGVVGESPLAESPAPANAPVGFRGGVMDAEILPPAEMGSGDSSLLGGILEPASDAKEPETAGGDIQQEFLEGSVAVNATLDETFERPDQSKFVKSMTEGFASASAASGAGMGAQMLIFAGLVVAAIALLKPVIEKLVNFFVDDVWPVLKPVIQAFSDVFVQFLRGLEPYARRFGEAIGNLITTIADIVVLIVNAFKEIFVNLKDTIVQMFTDVGQCMGVIVKAVTGALSLLFTDPVAFFKKAFSALGEILETAVEFAVSGLKTVLTGIKDLIFGLPKSIVGWFKKLPFFGGGKDKEADVATTVIEETPEMKAAREKRDLAQVNAEAMELEASAIRQMSRAVSGMFEALNLEEMNITASVVNIYPGSMDSGVQTPTVSLTATPSMSPSSPSGGSAPVYVFDNTQKSATPADVLSIGGAAS